MLGSLQLSHSSSDKSEVTKGLQASLNRVTLWRCGRSDSMMSKVWFAPHRKSPFPHLAPSMYGQTPVSRDTACKDMSSWSWHLVPSCQQQWYSQLHMGNYTLGLQGCQSVCTIWAPMPWRYPLKQSLGRLCMPTMYHQWSTQPGLPLRQNSQHKRDGFWRL